MSDILQKKIEKQSHSDYCDSIIKEGMCKYLCVLQTCNQKQKLSGFFALWVVVIQTGRYSNYMTLEVLLRSPSH